MSRGIFYGYRIVAASIVIQMMYLGSVFTYGVLFPEFESEFGWSRATISGAASLSFFVLGLFGIVMGKATDRFGPRIVLTISGIIYAAGYMLLHRVTTTLELYLFYGILCGLGIAALEFATLSTIARWFIRYRGMMSGIVKAGAGAGQVLFPLIAAVLVTAYGWRHACLLIGIVVLIGLVAMAQIMRRDPAMLGLQPLGSEKPVEGAAEHTAAGLNLKAALARQQFWILCLAKFSDMFCSFTIVVHIVPYGIDQGLAPSVAVAVLSTIGGCSIIGRILLGSTYDWLGAKHSLLICFALLLVSFILLQTLTDPQLLFLFALIYGIAHGGFFAIVSPSVADYFGTKSHGAIFGVVFFAGTLGGTIGPLLSGMIFDLTGNYKIAVLLLSGFAIFGLLLASRLRPSPIANQ